MKFLFRLSRSYVNRSLLQVLLTGLFLAGLIYFVHSEHLQVWQMRAVFNSVHTGWLAAGFILCIVYIVLQAALYSYAFKSVGAVVPLSTSLQLFLKRNFVSTFLPAGSFTSLAFFEDELDKHKLNRTQIRSGSFLFVVASMVSVFVIAIPAYGILLLGNHLRSIDLYALAFLVALLFSMVYIARSIIRQHGFIYALLMHYFPGLAASVDELRQQYFHTRMFLVAILISIAIELVGVVHLYIAMAALGVHPSIAASFVGYVVMVIILSVSPFLRGMGAIEVSLVYILSLYGQPVLMAASVTLLFRLFEFWIPFVAGLLSFFLRRGNILLRFFPAGFMLLLGIVNIISALTPAIPERLRLLAEFIPFSVTQLSTAAVLVLGVILLVASAFLLTGARNAWKIALVVSILSLIGHLTKAIDYEEALLALVTIIVLLYTSKAYFVKHDIAFQYRAAGKIIIAVVILLVYAVIGFSVINGHEEGIRMSLRESFTESIKTMVFLTGSIRLPADTGNHFLMSVQAGSVLIIAYILYVFMHLSRNHAPDKDETEKAAKILEQHGNSSLDFFKVYPDKQFFFGADDNAFISYGESQHYAVVLEAPVAPDEATAQQLVCQFEEYCREQGLRTFYYRVSEAHLALFEDLHKKSILIGQEAVVDLDAFNLAGSDRKSLRNGIRKAEQNGLHVDIHKAPLAPDVMQALKKVSDNWLQQEGHRESGFTQGIFDETIVQQHTVLALRDRDNNLLAFADVIPDYRAGEATYDMLRYIQDIPNGSVDFLMVKMMEYFRAEHYRTFNMGLAAFAGFDNPSNMSEQVIRFYRDHFKQASRFKGLYEYKNKFGPVWENRYLVYDQLYDLLRFPAVLKNLSDPE
ncbi:phosphatidylglycerol lysyltransferase domain-containing protein [Ohtaekwangia sp.]|uniref:phosphatidylglycerol lysyltransferase domain-containing protein n=1 Tax=Ohtaekwangia sp. TaxID=2066019 RepID=UPI002FDE84ED